MDEMSLLDPLFPRIVEFEFANKEVGRKVWESLKSFFRHWGRRRIFKRNGEFGWVAKETQRASFIPNSSAFDSLIKAQTQKKEEKTTFEKTNQFCVNGSELAKIEMFAKKFDFSSFVSAQSANIE